MWGRPKNRRKLETQRRWRMPAIHWRRVATSCTSVLATLGVIAGIVWAIDQPIQTVAVAGSFQRVSPADVERAVKQSARGAGLVSVNLQAVRSAVQHLPWVDTVSVQRSWPRGLKVTIAEQVAAARWGETGLLNTRGELFASEARHIPLELPQLTGPDGSETAVALRYLSMHGRLTETGMRLTALRLDARGAWEFDLDNGVTVRLGRKQVDERFETFMATAVKIIAQRASDIAYVDMRYSSGFAIGWRSGAARGTRSDSKAHDA